MKPPYQAAQVMLISIRGTEPIDFHALTSSQVEKVLQYAQQCGYHKPRNANGSRARYFYAYLERLAKARKLEDMTG